MQPRFPIKTFWIGLALTIVGGPLAYFVFDPCESRFFDSCIPSTPAMFAIPVFWFGLLIVTGSSIKWLVRESDNWLARMYNLSQGGLIILALILFWNKAFPYPDFIALYQLLPVLAGIVSLLAGSLWTRISNPHISRRLSLVAVIVALILGSWMLFNTYSPEGGLLNYADFSIWLPFFVAVSGLNLILLLFLRNSVYSNKHETR